MKSENEKTVEYIESKGFTISCKPVVPVANVVPESTFPVTYGIYHLKRNADQGKPVVQGKPVASKEDDTTGAYLDARFSKETGEGNKDRITCRSLFLSGTTGAEKFDRAHALNYVQKVMLQGMQSKGRKDKAHGENGRTQESKGKKRSNGHHGINPNESIIEDIAQNAFIHFWQARKRGADLPTNLCCKAAIYDWMKSNQKHKRACLAFKIGIMDDKHKMEREENRQAQLSKEASALALDKDTNGLLEIVRLEGNARIKTLARGMKTSAYLIRHKLETIKEKEARLFA